MSIDNTTDEAMPAEQQKAGKLAAQLAQIRRRQLDRTQDDMNLLADDQQHPSEHEGTAMTRNTYSRAVQPHNRDKPPTPKQLVAIARAEGVPLFQGTRQQASQHIAALRYRKRNNVPLPADRR